MIQKQQAELVATADAILVPGIGRCVPAVIPAPDGSLIQGPAVLNNLGKRIGQLIFVQEEKT